MDTSICISSFMLTNTNYRHWAMTMEVTLGAYDDLRSSTPFLQAPKMDTGMCISSFALTNTNYPHWTMMMEVTLEASDL